MIRFSESVVEEATLECLRNFGWITGCGPDVLPACRGPSVRITAKSFWRSASAARSTGSTPRVPSRHRTAAPFGCGRTVVTGHVGDAFRQGAPDPQATGAKFARVQAEAGPTVSRRIGRRDPNAASSIHRAMPGEARALRDGPGGSGVFRCSPS